MALDQSDTLAVTAIVISLIALVSTVGQIIQQYLGTSEGYRRCRTSVMGLWGKATRRKFDWGDMRYEVFFETPVLFMAGPGNTFGPIQGRGICFLDGSEASYKRAALESPSNHQGIAYGNIEMASWVTLLAQFQRLERESRIWDKNGRLGHGGDDPQYSTGVQIQRATQSWSFVPSGVVKPYANSTISHLVGMVTMLGMRWIAFDQASGNVIAEGNGMVLTSALVQGLGLLVTFAVTGKNDFEAKRVIPTEELKSLCFGSVPSILGGNTAGRAGGNIKLGSRDEIVTTLESLGCDFDTITKYQKNHRRIFSVVFEVIGMLGKCFRFRNSSFKRLPNPTTDYWPGNFSALKLLQFFHETLSESRYYYILANQPRRVFDLSEKLHHQFSNARGIDGAQDPGMEGREIVHDALDECTHYLQTHSPEKIIVLVGDHITYSIQKQHDPGPSLNSIRRRRPVHRYNEMISNEELLIEIYFGFLDRYAFPRYPPEVEVVDATWAEGLAGEEFSVWITLIFRMLCWLLLHDFDPQDLKIVPSNLKGSRIPVYIG